MIANARSKRAPRTPPLDPPLKPMKHKASSHPPQEKSARLKNSKKKFFARTQPFIDKNNYKEVM